MKNKTKIEIRITFYEVFDQVMFWVSMLSILFCVLQLIPAAIQVLVILFGNTSFFDVHIIHDIFIYDPKISPQGFIELPFSPLVSCVFFFWFFLFLIKKSHHFDLIKTLTYSLDSICPYCDSKESEIVSTYDDSYQSTITKYEDWPMFDNEGKNRGTLKKPYNVECTIYSHEYTHKCKSCGRTWITGNH